MESGFYSLSSKKVPGNLVLEIHHGMDFEVPYSQANYNFLEYKFIRSGGSTASSRIYLNNWASQENILLDREVDVTPDFEPYDRETLPKEFISSVLLTMTLLGYSASFDDFENEKIRLTDLFNEEQLETEKTNWIKQMDGMKV